MMLQISTKHKQNLLLMCLVSCRWISIMRSCTNDLNDVLSMQRGRLQSLHQFSELYKPPVVLATWPTRALEGSASNGGWNTSIVATEFCRPNCLEVFQENTLHLFNHFDAWQVHVNRILGKRFISVIHVLHSLPGSSDPWWWKFN